MTDEEKAERRRQYKAEWARANRGKENEARRKRNARNRESVNAWAREYTAVWRERNRETIREKSQAYRDANREHVRDYTRKQSRRWYLTNKYGLSVDDYKAMLERQGYACAVCGVTDPGKFDWRVDHCHTTGRVRGLLCHNCNVSLGLLKEDVGTLQKMIDYVTHHQEEVNGHHSYSTGEARVSSGKLTARPVRESCYHKRAREGVD